MINNKLIKVLSIDGGGIRGIIPAMVLVKLDQLVQERLRGKNKKPRPLAQLFDLIGGTSTGGIIAAGLAAPQKAGSPEPRITPSQLVNLYTQHGKEIFPDSLYRKLRAFVEEKYDAKPLEIILKKLLGDTTLQAATTNIIITSYDIEKRDVKFFKCRRHAPRPRVDPNYRLRDVARATSAAPTYFEPAYISRIRSPAKEALIDGGVYVSNPALCAYIEARKLYRQSADILVVSLGAGQLNRPFPYREAKGWGYIGWANPGNSMPILSVMMDGQSDNAHYHLEQLLGNKRYFRFDDELKEGLDDLDNATTTNLNALARIAEGIIKNRARDLQAVAEFLT